LKRTALGLPWEPGQHGGRDPYLCEEDVAAFEGMVVQHANQLNCLTTHQAMYIALFLKKARLVKACDLLESIGSGSLQKCGYDFQDVAAGSVRSDGNRCARVIEQGDQRQNKTHATSYTFGHGDNEQKTIGTNLRALTSTKRRARPALARSRGQEPSA
jgi:hypothetical protein